MSLSAFAQEPTQGNFPGAYRYKDKLYIDSLLYLPSHNSITPIPLRNGALRYNPTTGYIQLWKSSGWINLVSGSGLALDSVRRSNDTLFFRYTAGGELPIKITGLYISSIMNLTDSLLWIKSIRSISPKTILDTVKMNTVYMNTTDTASTFPFYLNAFYTNVNKHSLNPFRSNLRLAYTTTPGPAVNGPEGTGLTGGVIVDASNTQNLIHADLGLNGGNFTAGNFGSGNIKLFGCVNAQIGVVAGSIYDAFWYKTQLTNTNTIGTAWVHANGFWIPSSLSSLGTLASTGFLIGPSHTGHWNAYYGTSLNNYMGNGNTLIGDTTGDGVSKLYVAGNANIVKDTMQLKISTNANNYLLLSSKNSTGSFNITATGTDPNRTLTIAPATIFPAGVVLGTDNTNIYIGSVTAAYLDSSTRYLFGGAARIQGSVAISSGTTQALSVNNSYATLLTGGNSVSTPPTGINNIIAGLVARNPIVSNGGSTVNKLIAAYVNNTVSGGYSLYSDTGLVQINGAVNLATLKNNVTQDSVLSTDVNGNLKLKYIIADATKVNVSDTATMLNPNYVRTYGRIGGQLITGTTATSGNDFLTLKASNISNSPFDIDSSGITGGGGSKSANTIFKASRTYINPTSNPDGFRADITATLTTSPYAGGILGALLTPTIGATNTQNWTGGAALQGVSAAPTTAAGATGTISGLIGGTFAPNLLATGTTITNLVGARVYFQSILGTITNQTMLLLGTNTFPSGNWGIHYAGSSNNYFGTGNNLLNTTTDVGLGEKLQVNGRISISKATQSIDAVRKDQLDSVGNIITIPTWQTVTTTTNGNNTNQLVQIKGLGGNVLPGYALEMYMDSVSTPKTGNINVINRPSGVPVELRLNYLSGTYASPSTIRLGGAGNDITVIGGNAIDSGHTNMIVSGSHSFAITTITNSTILDNTYFTVLGNNSSDITVTLPTASSCTGRIYHIKKVSNNANTITINVATGITIDGSATDVIATFNQSKTYQSSGTNWIIL